MTIDLLLFIKLSQSLVYQKKTVHTTTSLTDSEELKRVFKCIQPTIPPTNNAIFIKQPDGSLKFDIWYADELSETDTGYVDTTPGDSGSPYWTETKTETGIKTYTILAVQNSRPVKYGNRYSTNQKQQCRNVATKVSQEIVKWVYNEFEFL